MHKAVSLALLGGGILLIIFGVSIAGSFSSDMSRFFTGAPTDKAMRYQSAGLPPHTPNLSESAADTRQWGLPPRK